MLIYVLINKLCAYYVTLVPLCPHYTSQLCTIMCIMCMQMYMGHVECASVVVGDELCFLCAWLCLFVARALVGWAVMH